jgi:glycerol uptake facilitator
MADTQPQPGPTAETGGQAGETISRVPPARAPMGMTFVTGMAGDMMAEFFGTMVLIAFGDGVVAMAVAALNQSGRGTAIFVAAGDWLLITFGWAFAVTLGVYAAGGITGAHINPAVTLAFAVRGDFPWRKVGPYWLAQVAGAFVGAALVFLVYNEAITAYQNAHHVTPGGLGGVVTFSIFATFPAPYFHGNWWGPFIDEVVGTAFLLIGVASLVDRRNLAPKSNLTPFLVGIVVAAIGMSYGANSGYAINPARDFGPRSFAWIAGWGQNAFPGNGAWFSNYWWIPIVAPLVGGVIGILLYDLFIKNVLVARGVPEATD